MTDKKSTDEMKAPGTTNLVAPVKRVRMIARRDVRVKMANGEAEIVKAGNEFECSEAEAVEFEKPIDGYLSGAGHVFNWQMETAPTKIVRAERVMATAAKAS